MSERKKKLSQQQRCIICLKVGHLSTSCPNSQKKPCCDCKKKAYHNRCLCQEKFTLESTNSLIIANSASDPAQSSTTSNLSITNSNSNATNVTQSLLALGERVLLQTAVVQLHAPDGKVTVATRILIDSASQHAFMTSQLAQKLNLTSGYKEVLSVSTFGAQRVTDIDMYVVRFKVKLKNGSYNYDTVH